MSKARLIITAVIIEGRSPHEVARVYGVNQRWVSRLVARYRAEGEAAYEPRSRRPHTSPTAIPPATLTLITELRGKLHIGRTHARTPVLLLVHDLHVRVVNAATGELLRELIIDPARDYQPIHPQPTNTTSPRTPTAGSG
jgi:hypothetical protein